MPLDAASIFILAGIMLAFMLFGGALMWPISKPAGSEKK